MSWIARAPQADEFDGSGAAGGVSSALRTSEWSDVLGAGRPRVRHNGEL